MAKRPAHMSAAPAYIVYGHRHSVRLLTRLIAIGLLLAAIATVFFGILPSPLVDWADLDAFGQSQALHQSPKVRLVRAGTNDPQARVGVVELA